MARRGAGWGWLLDDEALTEQLLELLQAPSSSGSLVPGSRDDHLPAQSRELYGRSSHAFVLRVMAIVAAASG